LTPPPYRRAVENCDDKETKNRHETDSLKTTTVDCSS